MAYEEHLQRCMGWIYRNSITNQGICVSSRNQNPYPEVTGYFIPSLIRLGESTLARQYANWLVSIQWKDGSWPDWTGKRPNVFDTGQILKGLISALEIMPELSEPIRRGCDWLYRQIGKTGQFSLSSKNTVRIILQDGKAVPDAFHLYALEPLKTAAEKWGKRKFERQLIRSLDYYLAQEELTRFSYLSHFHAYILEALVDLGAVERASEGMNEVALYQRRNGSIPATPDVFWFCSTGILQYAVIWYKLGDQARGDAAFDFACSLQNESGGFYGGYGQHASYFPDEEISWPLKFFLDAYLWRTKIQEGMI